MLDPRAEITQAAFNSRAKRRRSIKAFLPISLTNRASHHTPAFNPKTAGSVPADIILEIAELLAPIDVLHFSLTSKYLRGLLLPSLYETILLKSSRKCRTTLPMLAKHPEVCACIRKLAVRPNYYLSWPRADDPLEENWVVDQIEKLAPTLTGLHTFDWDGLEMPVDRLWQTLRRCCPRLKTVFSNVGCRPLDHDSHLFNFKGLTSFSLIVRHGLTGADLFPPLEPLPDRMWTMLLEHCPDLEELTICSFSSSSRLFDIERITEGSWPSLNTLTLGSFGYHQNFSLTPPATTREFGEFLSAHQALKYLRLSWNFKRWMSPEQIPMHLTANALPNLDSFIGVYQQLAELPDACCKRVENLDLTCEPVYESRVSIVAPFLQRLTDLKSLDVWVHVPNPEEQDHKAFFKAILGACPGLTELHFMCTTPFPAKPLKQLSSLLRLLPNLKTFSLTKGHKYRDDSMLQNALQIIRDNPDLKQVNIRWAREKSPNHLKQEGTYDVEKVISTSGSSVAAAPIATVMPIAGSSGAGSSYQGYSTSSSTSPSNPWITPPSTSIASTSKIGGSSLSQHLRKPSSFNTSESDFKSLYDEFGLNQYISNSSSTPLSSPISPSSPSAPFSAHPSFPSSSSSSGLGLGVASGSGSSTGSGPSSSTSSGSSSAATIRYSQRDQDSLGQSQATSIPSSSASEITSIFRTSVSTSILQTPASTSTQVPIPRPRQIPAPTPTKKRIILTITANERGIPLIGRPFVKKFKQELVIPIIEPPSSQFGPLGVAIAHGVGVGGHGQGQLRRRRSLWSSGSGSDNDGNGNGGGNRRSIIWIGGSRKFLSTPD